MSFWLQRLVAHVCVHTELGGPLCSASELKRLIALLRSFPTTAAWDHLLLKVAPCRRSPRAPFSSCWGATRMKCAVSACWLGMWLHDQAVMVGAPTGAPCHIHGPCNMGG